MTLGGGTLSLTCFPKCHFLLAPKPGGQRRSLIRKLEKTCALLALGIATALPVCAQLQPAVGQAAAPATISSATSGTSKLAFDAASIWPIAQEFSLKGLDFLNPASDAAAPPGGLFSWNVEL
jgi:hypothetical protein